MISSWISLPLHYKCVLQHKMRCILHYSPLLYILLSISVLCFFTSTWENRWETKLSIHFTVSSDLYCFAVSLHLNSLLHFCIFFYIKPPSKSILKVFLLTALKFKVVLIRNYFVIVIWKYFYFVHFSPIL